MRLNILTPNRSLLSVACDGVSLPGDAGDMEVFDGHAPLLTSLKTGVLTFIRPAQSAAPTETKGSWHGDGQTLSLMVSGGFAEVDNEHVTVLTDHAALPEEVDAPEVRKTLENMEKEISEFTEDHHDYQRLTAEIERHAVKLNIVH